MCVTRDNSQIDIDIDVNTIKGDIDEMKKVISDKMYSKLPEAIMLDIKRQLRKNSDLATKIDALDTRMTTMEASLTAIHLHQAQQIDLLQTGGCTNLLLYSA
ncbi:hypothetical protein AgCh_040264 [Apium graveolens]